MTNRPLAAHGIRLKPGVHASFVYTDPMQVQVAMAFLAEGLRRQEACVILAYARFNERAGAQLRDLHGIDVRRAMSTGQLVFMNGQDTGKNIRAELQKHLAEVGKQFKASRLLACFGWGEEGWPDEPELIQLDTQLNAVCEEFPVAALCLYDARQINGALLLEGALECHPLVFVRGVPHKNPFFVQPARLAREMGVRKREQSKIRSWID